MSRGLSRPRKLSQAPLPSTTRLPGAVEAWAEVEKRYHAAECWGNELASHMDMRERDIHILQGRTTTYAPPPLLVLPPLKSTPMPRLCSAANPLGTTLVRPLVTPASSSSVASAAGAQENKLAVAPAVEAENKRSRPRMSQHPVKPKIPPELVHEYRKELKNRMDWLVVGKQQESILRQAAQRLMRPKLAWCFRAWLRDWEAVAITRAKDLAAKVYERKLAEQRAMLLEQSRLARRKLGIDSDVRRPSAAGAQSKSRHQRGARTRLNTM
mmetsp:Transcript_17878/g.29809  ORF Transcript_17878/g.29809 Transcript_17878/m.29809 type:complete len:269 (-) Transcript_17878:113-919(-)